ncbi:hypothetical protein Hdeb2414_s0005g00173871 [Helianthus debilis subsp. tardiflorus]
MGLDNKTSSISGSSSSSGSCSLRLGSFELLTEPITSSSRASRLVYTPSRGGPTLCGSGSPDPNVF